MKKYILTIDQGTTSSRAILFNKLGQAVAKYQMEFTQIRVKPGYVEHNANEIYETVVECIRNVINESNIDISLIDSIAITNQRETTVLFDKAGNPLSNAIVWQSKQSEYIAQKLKREGYEEMIFEKTGLHINSYFSATKIRYLLDNNPNVKTVCYPHSVGLIHDGSYYITGTMHSARDTFKFSERYEQKIKYFVLSHSGIDEETYKDFDRVEAWMTAEDMVKYGIVDEIL